DRSLSGALTMADTLLAIDDVVAGYGKMTILNGLSAGVARAAITTVIGPNGAGKSTLFRTIFGLLGVRSGRVALDGQDCTGFSPRRMLDAGVWLVPQGRNLSAEMSVLFNLVLDGGVLVLRADIHRQVRTRVRGATSITA